MIEKNISNPDLGIDLLSQELGLSRANLYRKLKAVTELSPTELIRNKRLEVAAKLLLETNYTVSEVAVYTGFNSHAYFTNCFKSFMVILLLSGYRGIIIRRRVGNIV